MSKNTEAAIAVIVALVAPLVWFAIIPTLDTIRETWGGESVAFLFVYAVITFVADAILLIYGVAHFWDEKQSGSYDP